MGTGFVADGSGFISEPFFWIIQFVSQELAWSVFSTRLLERQTLLLDDQSTQSKLRVSTGSGFIPKRTNKVNASLKVLIITIIGLASLISAPTLGSPGKHKGELYFYWGYNRSTYASSNLHFQGPGYDFTMNEATAHDKPSSFSAGLYLNPARMTVPQYEARIGYYISERTNVSIGMTHMKYVVTQNQGTTISGYINESASTEYAGEYDNTLLQMDYDFLMFEHTDGLNFGNVEIETMVPAWENTNQSLGLYVTVALGLGIVTPKTDVTLLGGERSDRMSLAGYGINTKVGLKFEFLTRCFLHYFISMGWMNLDDIPTRGGGQDTVDQNLFFLENALVGGLTVYSF